MRLLILSEGINWKQRYDKSPYSPPSGVLLEIGDLNQSRRFSYSLFDFDVSVINIHEPRFNSLGYYYNIPKILRDSLVALEHGRTIICLPGSENFRPQGPNERGPGIYEWLKNFGIELQDNEGEDIKPSGAGRAHVITEYLKKVPRYYQILVNPQVLPERRLAVVSDTEIVVGLEHSVGKGFLVILPPPSVRDEDYHLSMSRLVDIARRYYDRAQRSIPVGDAPEWLSEYLVHEAKKLDKKIEKLMTKKSGFDRFSNSGSDQGN